MHEVYHSTMKDNPRAFARDSANLIDQVLSSEKTVFYGNSITSRNGKGDYVALDIPEKTRIHTAWVFKKGSELLPLFNYHLLKMQESGAMQELFRVSAEKNSHNFLTFSFQDWMYNPTEQFAVPEAISLGYENTLFPFLVLACSAFLVLCLLLLEVIADHCIKKH